MADVPEVEDTEDSNLDHLPGLRASLDAGKREYQQRRAERLEKAREEARRGK